MTVICKGKSIDTFKDFVEELLDVARISDLSENFNDFFIGQKVEAREVFPFGFKVNREAFSDLLKLKISIDQRVVYCLSSAIFMDICL